MSKNNSCKGCEKRYVGCHSECKEYMAGWNERRANEKKRLLESTVMSHIIAGVERTSGERIPQKPWKR